MFDLAKWENAHPAVKRFARQVADVLESVAEHLIGQADAAVSAAIDSVLPGTPDAASATEPAGGAPTDPPPVHAPEAPAQPAGVTIGGTPVPGIPADVAAWLAASGWTPPGPIHGQAAASDSGGAGSTLATEDQTPAPAPMPGVDHPVTGPVESTGPRAGADVPVWHNIDDPANLVGQGNAGT